VFEVAAFQDVSPLKFYMYPLFPNRDTHLDHRNLLYFSTLTILGDLYKNEVSRYIKS